MALPKQMRDHGSSAYGSSAGRHALSTALDERVREGLDRAGGREPAYPRDAQRFVEDIASDPVHAQAYLQALGIWDESAKLRPPYDAT